MKFYESSDPYYFEMSYGLDFNEVVSKNNTCATQWFDPLVDRGKIIFVTAYDEYALKAFDANAIDYLLKPIRKER